MGTIDAFQRQVWSPQFKQNCFPHRSKMGVLKSFLKTLPHAFSTRTELVATAALVAASVDYFKRYEELPPLDLHVHKQEAITACNDGHLRKRTLKRFLLICDHPRLARFYLTQRRIVNVAMFWKRH